tara:strand:- start:10967 stop:11113 length:147 start_codon:yes stop_codon:yes gene_type:complete
MGVAITKYSFPCQGGGLGWGKDVSSWLYDRQAKNQPPLLASLEKSGRR